LLDREFTTFAPVLRGPDTENIREQQKPTPIGMGWLKNAYERYAFFAFLTFLTAVLVDFFVLQHAIVQPSIEGKLRANCKRH
jgi:hypothetical protein